MLPGEKKVLCFCTVCRGSWVSKYMHKKHMQLYQVHNPTTFDLPSVDSSLAKKCDSINFKKTTKHEVAENSDSSQDKRQKSGNDTQPVVDGESTSSTVLSSKNDSDSDFQVEAENIADADTAQEMDISDQSYLYHSGPAVIPLFEGSQHSVLPSLVKHFTWFCKHPGISKEALSSVLAMQHTLLPPGNNLPNSYEKALRIIEPYLIQPTVFDCCPNDCIVFRGEYALLSNCPKCGKGRYISERSSIPIRQFTYLPLKPRLCRLFGNTTMAQVLQAHATMKNSEVENVFDIHQSSGWKNAYCNRGIFQGDSRGLLLALCTNGVNPFAHNKVSYSMWPIMLTLLNLPRKIRNHFESILLVGIIPSNGSHEPKSLDPYLEILVDELLELSGTILFDSYKGAPFTCKLALLLYGLDYPGVGKVMSVVGSGGLQGCMFCDIQGTRNEDLQKTIYLQNRRFLCEESSLRKDATKFPGSSEELMPPPNKKVYHQMKTYHEAYDNAINQHQARLMARCTGCKGSYALMKLPYHNRVNQMVPDAMHTVKNCVEKIVYLISGKSHDRDKVLKAETALRRFNLTPTMNVPWILTKDQLKLAEERIRKIRLPSFLNFTPYQLFQNPSQLKSHDWKQIVCQSVLKFCIHDMLPKQQEETLFLFLDTLKLVLAESHHPEDLDNLSDNLNTALALLERDFPISIQDITTHLLHHIVEGIQRFGPVYSTWMYSYERFNSWLSRRALNRFRPEATIMETYHIFEWCQFMTLSETAISCNNDEELNYTVSHEAQLNEQDCAMFKHLCMILSIPVQPPVNVAFLRKVCLSEKTTGRFIDYKSKSLDSEGLDDCTFVSFNYARQFAIGYIERIFMYREAVFTTISKFDCAVTTHHGLVLVTDCTANSKVVCTLKDLSRPLAIAEDCHPKLWIINAL